MAFCVENKQQTKLWQIAALQLDYCRNNEKFPVYSLEQINEMYEFKKKLKSKSAVPCKAGSKGCPSDSNTWYVKPPL